LIAALDGATGKVTATDVARNDSVHFIEFLEQIDAAIDPDLAVHVVIDNGSSHRSKATKKWFAEHPRFVVHHTPVHASWLNQVESFFSILTPKCYAAASSTHEPISCNACSTSSNIATPPPPHSNGVYNANRAA
jgi:DDE superfamily endonuclease